MGTRQLVHGQRQRAAKMRGQPKPVVQAPPASSRTPVFIDLSSLPESPAERIATDHVLQGAIQSLHGEGWLPTEAVVRVTKLFNTDIHTWYIAEPVSTASDPPAGDHGETRLRLLEDSHQYVVLFVHTNRCHWTVGIINRQDKTIRIYDPLRSKQRIDESRQAVQDFARRLPRLEGSDPATERWSHRRLFDLWSANTICRRHKFRKYQK